MLVMSSPNTLLFKRLNLISKREEKSERPPQPPKIENNSLRHYIREVRSQGKSAHQRDNNVATYFIIPERDPVTMPLSRQKVMHYR